MQNNDKAEKGFRFGCDFVFGLFLFGFGGIWYVYDEVVTYTIVVMIAATACGRAAVKFGAAFWRWFARTFSWFS